MRRFNIPSARSLIGQRINLNLKDGSVIINVFVIDVQLNKRKSALRYRTPSKERVIRLREIAWVEPLKF